MAYIIQDNELRLLAKAANERMRQLEKRDINSPAYQSIQSKLEMLGVKKTGAKGRRFSETGKATRKEAARLKKILKDFQGQKTSTLRGAKDLENRVWTTANKKYNLSGSGVSKREYFDMWQALPSAHDDRRMGSDIYVRVIKTVQRLRDENKYEGEMTYKEIISIVESSRTPKEAYKRVGITYRDIRETERLDRLGSEL